MSFLLPIIYMALAGIGLTIGVEATKNLKITPVNQDKEMAEARCRQTRLAPWIGANDPCSNLKVANIAEKK